MRQLQNIVVNIGLMLLIAFVLSGCSGESCYDAEDFGFSNFVVSSRYTKEEMTDQSGEEQVAPWRNSSYRVNGRPLVIVVRNWTQGTDRNHASELSAWCPWYGASGQGYELARFCERLQECRFTDDIMCTDTKDAQVQENAPCIFKKGVGLYGLIASRGTDPNQSIATQKLPQGISFHLGEPAVGYEILDTDKNGNISQAGGIVYKYENNPSLKQEYSDGELYFKILDKFYDDNSGQYRVTIKSGITNTNPDPITFVTNLVKNFLFGVNGDYGLIRNIYKGIVDNPGYKLAVSSILSLYIMWTALSYLAGNVQVTHTELIVRVMKIAVVSALLSSEYSWSFFYDYLFVWFVDGMEQILGMIMEAGSQGPGGSGILGMMLAPQTLSKLFSLLFVDWQGFIYIILFFIALYFIILVYFDAAILYLTALIAIGMIITMGPIFVCFMLFGITRSLFENWLRQLISYAIQPIILFTGIIFISMILQQEIYGSLGFQVCKQGIFQSSNSDAEDGGQIISDAAKETLGFDIGNTMFYWWFPKPMKGEDFTRVTRSIPIPIDHFESGNNTITGADDGSFCEAYACNGQRYVDLPFLDPIKDQRRISQFWNGKFVQLDGLLLIFIAIYLLDKFNGMAVSVAKFIAGTSGNLTDIQNVANNASDGIRSRVNQLGNIAKARFNETKVGRKVTQIREVASGIAQNIKEKPSKWIDKKRIDMLKKEAISGKVNSAVAAEAKKISGLDHSKVKKGAISDYTRALKLELQKLDPNLSDKQAGRIAGPMSMKRFKDLENEFAKAKYGKGVDKLNAEEKKLIENIVNSKHQNKSVEELAQEKYGKKYKKLNKAERESIKNISKTDAAKKSLQELAADAEYSRKYAESYVDAYQALSDRGVGLIGKRSSVIRSLEEINHKAKTKQDLTKAKQRQTGEELYAGYENLKHGAFKAVAGRSENETVKALGNTYAGGAWNNIDTSKDAQNYRKQTYNEQLADRTKELAYQKVNIEINSLSKVKGASVISPEFIARVKIPEVDSKGRADVIKVNRKYIPFAKKTVTLEKYHELAKKQVEHTVYKELSSGDDPVLRGDKFMKEYAKDSEMVAMIDKAEKVKARLLDEDPFIAPEQQHELLVQRAESNIKDVLNKLEEHYNREIPAEELPEMLTKYNIEETNFDSRERRAQEEALEKSLKDFEYSQQVLQEIDQRKVDIVEEVDKHVSRINEYRKEAGMQEYTPASEPSVAPRSSPPSVEPEAVAPRSAPLEAPAVVEPPVAPRSSPPSVEPEAVAPRTSASSPAKIQPKTNQVGVRSKRTIDDLRRKP